eukprot:GILJ01012997.1.p1 GENE.GILJ01012997.1~~GILJ01012997.1.p1  ORF type:complete len:117 (-),score=40.39 GILJ01012997.1:48-398(-)
MPAVTKELLEKRAAAVRTGGKGTVRRTTKAAHRGGAEDSKVTNTLKKLGVQPMPDIDEVTFMKNDGSAFLFTKPKVQAAMQSQCFVVSGQYENKSAAEMLPQLVGDLKKAMEKQSA